MAVHWRSILAASALTLVAAGGPVAAAAASDPIVKATGGEIQGARLPAGGAAFKGIPYAAPPVGALRWREPEPVKAWTGRRDATRFGAPCVQAPQFVRGAVASEDCLFVNVFTPAWPVRGNLPVMVWIHGGGNYFGASSSPTYDSDSLARRGVVLVTFNYRLGNLGFFSDPALTKASPHHASGNQGILDQIAALKWVRANIAKFGGDPRNVTIFGESAGAIDVSALLATPLARGLFNRAIAESGSVVGIEAPLSLAAAEKNGEAAAKSWGLAPGASLQDMRAVPADAIVKADPLFARSHPDLGITVDGYVFPEDPAAVFKAGKEHRVALLHGNNARERIPGTEPPADLKQAVTTADGPLADRALKLYAAAATDASYGTPADQWADDTSFRCAAVAELAWHSAAGNHTYEYEFARVPAGREAAGATHASELAYVFGTLDHGFVAVVGPQPTAMSDTDRQVSDVMQRYWTNFAKTGDPNGGNLPKWPPFDRASHAYIQFTAAGPVAQRDLRRPFCDVFIANVDRQRGK